MSVLPLLTTFEWWQQVQFKSGCSPSERHSLTALTCFGGPSAECFFDRFMLLVLCFAALALRLRESCQRRGMISRVVDQLLPVERVEADGSGLVR